MGARRVSCFAIPKKIYVSSVSSALSTCHTPPAQDGNIANRASREGAVELFSPKPCTSLVINSARILEHVVLLTASDLRALSWR